MIQHEKDGAIFVHRVAAVIVDAERVLLHRAAGDDFWSLPGGRAELMEPSADGVRREMREELGIDIQVERLLWVAENFFRHQDRNYHEVGLYFLASLSADAPQLGSRGPFAGQEANLSDGPAQLTFQWFPRTPAALEEIHLLPAFLRAELVHLPTETKLLLNQVIKT